ncbi:NupC/NupG family nucleoside CNT transporter [Rhodothalassium salexigens]|uniref:NupC/NupG family nucleoside CNT transporter n=1 Tax=Rhodothalassium salexigens TaxID=1086 RepID=UPI0019131728|nr:nucleoside transporter C-terminal domain-containing protein [Rhodothalassium salexigens]MBK5910345.1 NupC/NupG family nucleoside CNT transporter [Rhodothalassium salexigens]MBK5921042.1 NupC/NupG family nucleoside CNT transporter [Rhodothalassium salexigens]
MPSALISLAGIAVILALAVALSTNRRAIRPRVVLAALGLQVAVAAFVFHVPAGQAMIAALSDGVVALLGYSSAGIHMVFGELATGFAAVNFAVEVLPIIIFFSSLMAVLYHLRLMQGVVWLMGGAIQRLVGTRPVESLCAAANIFVGQTEAPLVIRPYLGRLTDAQLFAVMTTGLASVSGTVLAAYAQMGVKLDYLLAASFMAAPAGLLMAKLILPGDPDDPAERDTAPFRPFDGDVGGHDNVIMAAANGAQEGVKLALNIGGMLIAFVSLIALANGLLGAVGGWVGLDGLTFEGLLGHLFAPVMALLAVPWGEAATAGALFGEKLILNEFVAYLSLAEVRDTLSPRTEAIVTVALAGFANLSSIAIQLGGIGTLIPDKRPLIARYGMRAVAAGSLANLLSAALTGLMIAPV